MHRVLTPAHLISKFGDWLMNNSPISNGWIVYPNNSSGILYNFWKSFLTPDGLEVEVRIIAVPDKYQVETEASSRSSLPTESVVNHTTTLDDALRLAYEECKEWDDYVLKRLQG
jgi:hypothetical protein